MKRKTSKTPGRPRLGKTKAKISLTPLAKKIAGRAACSLGLDLSNYIESLIRTANADAFLDVAKKTGGAS